MFTKRDEKSTSRSGVQGQWAKKRITILVIVLFLSVILLDISPVGGNIRFYTKWMSCGNKPVATDTSLHIDGSQPHYYEATDTFPELRGPAKLYCTPLQAEEAGYSASPSQYEFPAVEQYNQQHPGQKVHPGAAS